MTHGKVATSEFLPRRELLFHFVAFQSVFDPQKQESALLGFDHVSTFQPSLVLRIKLCTLKQKAETGPFWEVPLDHKNKKSLFSLEGKTPKLNVSQANLTQSQNNDKL